MYMSNLIKRIRETYRKGAVTTMEIMILIVVVGILALSVANTVSTRMSGMAQTVDANLNTIQQQIVTTPAP